MKRRLFLKILLGFWLTYLLLSGSLLLFWSIRPTQVYPEWDPPYAVGNTLVASAARALAEGGPEGLARHMASWSPADRERLTVSRRPADGCTPDPDPRVIVKAVGRGTCLRYDTPPPPDNHGWNGMVAPPVSPVAASLAGLVFSAVLAWYLTSPIHRLRQGFNKLARGDLTARLGPSMGRRRDEVADLAQDFDLMAVRLQELVAARERLLHDVSHELRSPLARMRLATGLLRRDPTRFDSSLDRIEREAGHLDALVDELLTLAKLESGGDDETEYFDLLDVLRLALEDVSFEAATAGVAIDANVPDAESDDHWLVLGSGMLVHRALENVLRNALRFSNPGQTIGLTCERSADDKCVVIIEDEGPGIGTDGAVDLLQPFVQGPSADGGGFGLGLSIAKRAILTCGGTIDLRNRQAGGLRVTIVLPLVRNTLAPENPVTPY